MTVPLGGKKAAGRVALVDDGDYGLVSRYRWHVYEVANRGRRTVSGPYAITRIRRDGRESSIFMHRLITGYKQTDHWDRCGLNNQRYNLRDATSSQNGANSGPRTGRYKGVHQHKPGRWRAQIRIGRKQSHLGLFTSEEAAARAYDEAALAAWGEYAWLNFPIS